MLDTIVRLSNSIKATIVTYVDINKMTSNQCIRWCFTVNNFTEEDIVHLSDLFYEGKCTYMIVGKEVGEKGTPHLQGYMEMKSKTRMTALKKIPPFDKAHLEVAHGTSEQNITYCSKEEDVVIQKGNPKGNKASVVADILEKKRNGETDMQIALGSRGTFYAIHKRKLDELFAPEQKIINNEKMLEKYADTEWRYWQRTVLGLAAKPIDDRKVYWIWDAKGGSGKTYLSKYLKYKYNGIRFGNAKSADIAYAWNGEPMVIFDFSRSLQDHVNYDIIEQVKNGCLFSTKYSSVEKDHNVPNVFIFANFAPDQSKLSADRWRIIDIQSYMLFVESKK